MAGIHPRITKQFRPELAQKVTDLTCARPRFFFHSIFGYAYEGAASLYGSAPASAITSLSACGTGVPLAPFAHAVLLPRGYPEHVVCN